MKVCIFYIHNLFACHYALFGYRETLERMGHEVLDVPFPSNQVQNIDQVRYPTVADLCSCDLVISAYHEYTQPWLSRLYGFMWTTVMNNVPVLARYDESMDRGDLQLPHRMPELLKWANYHSFPAKQDADKYGGAWLPYGADTTIFKPGPTEKKFELAFVGSLYPKREEYLQKLIMHVGKGRRFYAGRVMVQDLDGINERETTERLAENYRSIKIFFCLPPLSNLIVEKVFDVMACDTMVMFPRFSGTPAAGNLSLFNDDEHIVYYDYGFFVNNGKQVKYYLEHTDEVDRIARSGGALVRSKYTLEQMCQKMIDQAKESAVCASQQSTASLLK